MKEIEAKIEMLPFKVFQSEYGFNGKVQHFFTDRVYEYSKPYTPSSQDDSDGGNFISNVDRGEDYIHYLSPQALYLWNGKKMVDPKYQIGAFYNPNYGFWSRPGILKELTDIDLKYTGEPMRGPFWINRMWADEDKEITYMTQKYIDTGGKYEG